METDVTKRQIKCWYVEIYCIVSLSRSSPMNFNMFTWATLKNFKYLTLDLNQFPMKSLEIFHFSFERIRFFLQFGMQFNSFSHTYYPASSNWVLQPLCTTTLIHQYYLFIMDYMEIKAYSLLISEVDLSEWFSHPKPKCCLV